MIKIRGEIFETNSSSVHSLTFGTYGMEKCKLKVHKDGYIHTDYPSRKVIISCHLCLLH